MLPLVPLYAAGAALRWVGVTPKRLGCPVVSIGNLSTGGTGKTPLVIALVQLLKQEGIPVDNAGAAEEAYKQLKVQYGNNFAVVKAQIHAGGRGKGKIEGTEQRGVAVGKSAEEVKQIASTLLGGTLVTIQTGPHGKKVNKVLIAQDVYYPGANPVKEFYLSVLLDRAKGQNVIMYSTEGGMDIEEVAHNTPDRIFKEWVHPGGGLQPFQARKIAFNLGLSGEAFKSCVRFVTNIYNAYLGLDCSMVEINPLFKTSDDKIIAVDCKMNLDEGNIKLKMDLFWGSI